MNAHPRLYATPAQLKRLRKPVTGFLAPASKHVAKSADAYVASTQLKYDPTLHNSLLVRAREMQGRVITLLVRWMQTGRDRYRDAAVRDVIAMGNWPHWGWESWIANDTRPDAEFDLSYGENCTTLAIAYDWLYGALSEDQRKAFRDIAQKWAFPAFFRHVSEHKLGRPRHAWFGRATSNWNTVCAGGAGMLALAMYDELHECPEVLALVEESIAPYLLELAKTNGGWVEGIGYWNYGHRYAFMYLLSHSNAFGQLHGLLKGPGVRETLDFPLDFCPNGQPSSFGDVNGFGVLPFHYAAAEALNAPAVTAALDAIVAERGVRDGAWPTAAELLVFHPRRKTTPPKPVAGGVIKHYPDMDWFVLADKLPQPSIYLSIRGGTTDVPHAHRDLLSFHGVFGDEQLITNLGINGGDEYLDTTFSGRRSELFETSPASKNTILINGVGIGVHVKVRSRVITQPGLKAVRLEATEAMGTSRYNRPAATFCGRLFVMLDEAMFVIIDRVDLPTTGRVESRLHTLKPIKVEGDSVLIRGTKQKLRVTYAADVPAIVFTATTCPTTPRAGANVLRWCTNTRSHQHVTLVTVLSPGVKKLKVSVDADGVSIGARRLEFRPTLEGLRLLP
jgi:hypothetical protein